MNKLIIIISALLLTVNCYAADTKVSDLGAVNPTNADTMYIVQGGASQKATISNLFAAGTDLDADGVIAANSVALGVDTTGNYLATLADSGIGEVTVAGSGAESAVVTLAIGSGITRTSHRHNGEILSPSGIGATTITGNTVSGNTMVSSRLYSEDTIGTDGTISGNTVSGNLVRTGSFTFPLGDGGVNQVLKTNGAGILSWADDNNTGSGTAYSLDTLTGHKTTKVLEIGGLGTTGTISASTVSANTAVLSKLYSDATIGCSGTITGNTVSGLTVRTGSYAFPVTPPADNQIIKYDAGAGTLGWEADATGGGGTSSKSFTITNPNSTSDYSIWRTPSAITIANVHVLVYGEYLSIVTGSLVELNANGCSPVSVDSVDIVANCYINTDDDGALSNASIDAGDYIGWNTTRMSGNTVTSMTVTFEYT